MRVARSRLSIESIEAAIAELRRAGAPAATNYFRQPMLGTELEVAATEGAIAFLDDDSDFRRVYFYSAVPESLKEILSALPDDRTLVLDFITKEPDSPTDEVIISSGFDLYARFKRISNNRLPEARTNSRLTFAEAADAPAVMDGLIENLDKYTGHFPAEAQLLDWIGSKQVLVNKRAESIRGVLIYQLNGKKANFNQFYNKSDDASDFLYLLKNFYGIMSEKKITSAFGWVNEANGGVLRLHYSFGFTDDGLLDRIYKK
jgi:hypothetical protein